MIITPRHKIEINAGYGDKEIELVDSLYERCNAEFNSRQDIYNTFATTSCEASWARYYLTMEVRKIAMRENLYISIHISHVIAQRIAKEWFAQKEDV